MKRPQSAPAAQAEEITKKLRLGLGPGCELKDIPETRRFAREVAQAAGLDEERSYDLTVAVSEASANAIQHGNAEAVDIETVMNDDSVMVSVTHAGRLWCPSGSKKHPGAWTSR